MKTNQVKIAEYVEQTHTTIDGFNPDRDSLKKEIASLFSDGGYYVKGQERVHKVAVLAAIDWLKHMQPDMPMAVVAGAAKCKGSFRVQALAYWFTWAVGCEIAIGKDGSIKGKKNKDKQFDWKDRTPVQILDFGKENPFYRFAPDEAPVLKTPTLQKTSINYHTAARGLVLGTVTVEELDKKLAEAKKEITDMMKETNTKDWVKKYCEQEGIEQPTIQ